MQGTCDTSFVTKWFTNPDQDFFSSKLLCVCAGRISYGRFCVEVIICNMHGPWAKDLIYWNCCWSWCASCSCPSLSAYPRRHISEAVVYRQSKSSHVLLQKYFPFGPRQAKMCLWACTKCTDLDSSLACAKSHPGLCSPFIHSIVSNYSVTGKQRIRFIWTFAVRICPFSHSAAH